MLLMFAPIPATTCLGGICFCQVVYFDPSNSSGIIRNEKFTFDIMSIPNIPVIFGVGNENVPGVTYALVALLGLGLGPSPSQGIWVLKKWGVCLPINHMHP